MYDETCSIFGNGGDVELLLVILQIMLRAKQLTNFSSTARTFFLSGSRCAPDGSSCTCCEDESCVSRRQQHNAQIQPTSTRLGAVVTGNTVKVAGSHKVEGGSAPVSIGISNCVNYASDVDGSSKDTLNSPPVSDQFVKAGIAAVSYLSDLVNYKIPGLDGSGNAPKKSVIEAARPVSSVRSTQVKHIRRESYSKIQPKSSGETVAGSNHSTYNRGAKNKGDKNNAESFKRVPNAGNPHDTRGISSNTYERRTAPQRPSARSDGFTSDFNNNVRTAEVKVTESLVSEGFSKPSKDMKMPAGIVPRSRQFASSGNAVESVSGILRKLRWGPAAEKALGNANCSLDAYQANQVLKQVQDHTVALGFFYWLKQQAGFKHDEHTYTTMVGILGRSKQFGAINKLLSQMVSDGCRPNVVTYNRLIHCYGRANYLNEALAVFNQMQAVGCKPDRVTYCTLIDIHAKAGFLDVAMNMYKKMQAAGLSPDTFTYSVIINCLGKAGHLSSAHKLFCEMVDQGCVPNLVTYNIMIALQAKARNYECALKLYRDMQNAGFEPDKVTYSIVMEVLGHCGCLDEAEAVFAEMKRKNWVPDEPVYGLLVDLWGKSGNAGKAWEWYQAMLHAGLRPNVPTCNSLLSAFLRVHQLSDAYNLLHGMLTLGLRPSLQTYTLLLSCCTEARSPYDMGFCRELMAVSGHPAHTFLLSMPSAGPDGQNVRDHVSRFLDMMHSEDRESKRGLVDAVVDFLHKSGLKEEASSVWEVAAQKNVYPDAVKEKSSSYWLINLHVMSDGTAVIALSRTLAWFRKNMLTSGVTPSRIDIVTGWGRRSRVTGSSLVRQAVQELLHIFSFPFFTENGNSGCFVGCGEALNRWLLQSYVERMHLL